MMPRNSPRTVTLTELGMRATDLIRAGALPEPPAPRHRTRLTADQVVEIRRLASLGVPRAMLAKRFGITVSYVGQIVRGRSWRGVGDE